MFKEEEEEIECSSCGAEFIVRFDPESNEDKEPTYCTFCGELLEFEEEDDGYIEDGDE